MRVLTVSLLLALCSLCPVCGRAQAQSLMPTGPSLLQQLELDDPSPLEQLTRLRLDAQQERISAGYWLLGWSALSLVGGGALALSQHAHPAFLAAGVTSAGFGVINALLSLGFFDLSGAREQRIFDDRTRDDVFTELREAELVAELRTGQFYAINAGLDVAYLATGVLMYVLGASHSHSRTDWEKGVGVGFMSQSVFLLGFDGINWIDANQRAARVRRVIGANDSN
jgi:hypothetical protein